MLNVAIKEAQEDYADKINQSRKIKALFITGVAGNDKEGYMATSKFFYKGKWETITENGVEITGLLSKRECEKILENNNPNLEDIEVSEREFLTSAEEINEILHENAIHKDTRARFMSAILLALSRPPRIVLDQEPAELVNTINMRVNLVLQKAGKQDFSRFIHIDMPSSEDNHVKLKTAIIKSIQILLDLNIESAMQSGRDVLGEFYEVFLKYGNGAKEIGIVLTPRHITRFAAEVMDIQQNDLVLDPTCGTGGFLVAAFDEVRKKDSANFDRFKKYGLYGIEEQDPIIALALVNMIFRGDGKNNMIEGNCFTKWLHSVTRDGALAAEYGNSDNAHRLPPVTKVLMNPPFPKKSADKKEFLFVEHALKQMQDGSILFSVLPYACMVKEGVYKTWRQNLLKTNSLLSVITFPPELFYPVGVHTIGVFILKGVPQKNQKVLWLRAINDGFRLRKGKRLPHAQEPNHLEQIKHLLKDFLRNPAMTIRSKPEFQKTATPVMNTKKAELCPEIYLDDPPFRIRDIIQTIEKSIRENLAVTIKFEKELKTKMTLYEIFRSKPKNVVTNMTTRTPKQRKFNFTDIFDVERGHFHAIDKLEPGEHATISRVSTDNGIVGFYKKPKNAQIFGPGFLTVSTVTGDVFLQHHSFMATDNVIICIPRKNLKIATLVYIQTIINRTKWRYSYGRQPYKRILQKAEFFLPVNSKNELNEEWIERIVRAIPYFGALEKIISSNSVRSDESKSS